jgi:hypothetical protein
MQLIIIATLVLNTFALEQFQIDQNNDFFAKLKSSTTDLKDKPTLEVFASTIAKKEFNYLFNEYLGHDAFGWLFRVTPGRGGETMLAQVLRSENSLTTDIEKKFTDFTHQGTELALRLIGKQVLTGGKDEAAGVTDKHFLVLLFEDNVQPLSAPLKIMHKSSKITEEFMNVNFDILSLYSKIEKKTLHKNYFNPKNIFFFLPGDEDASNDSRLKLLIYPLEAPVMQFFFSLLSDSDSLPEYGLPALGSVLNTFIDANIQHLPDDVQPEIEGFVANVVEPLKNNKLEYKDANLQFAELYSRLFEDKDDEPAPFEEFSSINQYRQRLI